MGVWEAAQGTAIDVGFYPFKGVLTEDSQSTNIRDCFRWGTGFGVPRSAVGFQEVSRQGGLSIWAAPSSDFLLCGPNVSSAAPRKR